MSSGRSLLYMTSPREASVLDSLNAQPARMLEGEVADRHSHQADCKYHFAGLNGDIDYRLSAVYAGLRSHKRNLS